LFLKRSEGKNGVVNQPFGREKEDEDYNPNQGTKNLHGEVGAHRIGTTTSQCEKRKGKRKEKEEIFSNQSLGKTFKITHISPKFENKKKD